MAKKTKETPVKEESEKAQGQGRKVMITGKDGKEVARVDVIKNLFFQEGKKRGEIVKILESEYNHKVAYQIVFAATKTEKAKAADGETNADGGDEKEAA